MNKLPDGWVYKPLGEISDVKGGKRLPKGEQLTKTDTGFIYLRVSDMNEDGVVLNDLHYLPPDIAPRLNSYRVQSGDLYIVVVGNTIGKCGMIPPELDKAYLTENADRITNLKINPVFLLNILRSPIVQSKVERLRTDNAQPKLALTRLRSFLIPVPPLEEQRKIAAILGTWDKAIGLVAALIAALQERKKGLMQQMIKLEHTASSPTIRFNEFIDDWDKKNFNEVFNRVSRKNSVGNENVLTASAQYGLVNQQDFFKKSVAGKDLAGYYLLKKGEFAYNRSYSTGYPMGAIKRLDDYDAGVLSTLYLCFQLMDEDNCSDFFKHFFEAGGMNREIYTIAQEGARNHGLLNVGISDFFDLLIPVPSSDEQKKIAAFFEAQDDLIMKTQHYCDALTEQKKGLMQQLLTGQVRV